MTVFVPSDAAWARLQPPAGVDLENADTVRELALYLVVRAPVALPDPAQVLPEDAARGVRIAAETLNGAPLTVAAKESGAELPDRARDGRLRRSDQRP